MDLIWGHISLKPMTCPELKNISLTFWAIQNTLFRFGGHLQIYEIVRIVSSKDSNLTIR